MKTKQINEVRKIPQTEKDFDEEELRIKEEEIKNREDTLEKNAMDLALRKKQLELGKREAELRREEWELMKDNPMGYKETESWEKHLVKVATFEIDRVDESINNAEQAFEIIEGKIQKQNERCKEDLKELKTRVKRLKKKLKIKPSKK